MKRQEDTVTLRRKSQRILQWFFSVLLLALAALVAKRMGFNGPNKAQVGLTASFATVFLIQRIFRTRVLISQDEVCVVNAVFKYSVTRDAIAQALIDAQGNLKLKTTAGEEVYIAAYSGSLIDHYVGSADRAAEVIRQRLKAKPTASRNSTVRRRIAMSWLSEIWLAGAVICATWTAIGNAVG
ncbi:hypothetical protein [Streptomyces bugieae]|uniref:PH domain-containing protein n=1 Tax=Streptomyces bugieae TaxID=3098223 RepID=A0ABU7NP32_9ACTN|nr:hypothetical protein [Streptomyces sp. DSM 41528]